MAELEIVVRYKSRRAKIALTAVVAALPVWGILLPGWIILSLFSIIMGSASGFEPLRLVGPILGSLLVIILGVKAVLNLADNRIVLSKLGIEFPFFLGRTFGLRRTFSWATIRSVQLVEKKGKRDLVIHTTDGVPLHMNVNCFVPEELEQMLVGLDVWAANCKKDPALEALQDELQRTSDKRLLPSYTAMWESELSRRFSSTAYVPLEPGHELLGGKLKVQNQLSFGGLSAVYLCQQNERDLVILKEAVVPGDNQDETRLKAMELFVREARILMQLNHPSIVKVLDHFVENDRQYLVIEYRGGQDLSQFVKQNGAQREVKVLGWALEVVAILEYLHAQEPPIIHRDVTPDNLVLDPDGAIVMIDFGAANEFLGQATGTLVGKQSFIAPEQFRGKATVQSDLYALGCTLFYLLTAQEPVPLSVSHPKKAFNLVPESVDTLVASLTAMELEDRIQSASDARTHILACLAQCQPVEAS